jgi:hypothetical protein
LPVEITVKGDALLKVFVEIREPVTTTVSAARAGTAGQSAVAGVPGTVEHVGFAGVAAVCASARLGIIAIADSAVAPKSEQRIDTFKVNPSFVAVMHKTRLDDTSEHITAIS